MSSFVYMYDEYRGVEMWGVVQDSIHIPSNEEYFKPKAEPAITVKYTLKVEHTYPVGYILSEFISLDETLILESFNKGCAIESGELISKLLASNDYDGKLRIANSICIFREFVDLCNANSALKNKIWFNAFVTVSGGVEDWPEQYAAINPPVENIHFWEEKTYYVPVLKMHEYIIDYKEKSPHKNAEKLCDILAYEVGHYAKTYAEPLQKSIIVEKYSNPIGYMYRSLENLINENNLPKKCPVCSKYFVPDKRSDAIYCNRQSPLDESKTCKEYGARQAWQRTLKEDEAAGLYRKIYMSKQMLAKRNTDMPEYQQSFDKFRSESKQWKADIKAGTKTNEEYIAWLKSVKEKKIL